MAIIDVKINPTRRDLRIFVVLWVLFFLILGKIALLSLTAIMVAGIFTSTCLAVSLAFNRDITLRQQTWGFIIPGVLWAIYLAERAAAGSGVASLIDEHRYLGISAPGSQWLVLACVASVGVIGSAAMLVIPGASRAIYRGWMFAAVPVGWTVSHLVLAIVFYGVFTPIGLLMRALGKDPMARGFDRAATTYWITRTQQRDPKRYFRQF